MKIEVDFENLMLTILSPELIAMREILEVLESITESNGTDCEIG